MSEAKDYNKAMDLAWKRMARVYCPSSDSPRRCNNCESYKQYGLTACMGCCGR